MKQVFAFSGPWRVSPTLSAALVLRCDRPSPVHRPGLVTAMVSLLHKAASVYSHLSVCFWGAEGRGGLLPKLLKVHLRDLGTSLFLPLWVLCCQVTVSPRPSGHATQGGHFAPSSLRVEDAVSPNSRAPLPLLLPKICCTDFENKFGQVVRKDLS